MEVNFNTFSALVETNRITPGESLVQFAGRSIGFKPGDADSIGGGFLGWRSRGQQEINNRVRNLFLKSVLKELKVANATQLPENVKKAMELNDYCGVFGDKSSLTTAGGSTKGKPLSLRRIRAVVEAVKDYQDNRRTVALSQLDRAINCIRVLSSSPTTIRELNNVSLATVSDWMEQTTEALGAVRDAIANNRPVEEIAAAIRKLCAFADGYGQVARTREMNAKNVKASFDEGRVDLVAKRQSDALAFIAMTERNVLVEQVRGLASLYKVKLGKNVPPGISREPEKRDMFGNYYSAVMTLNRFRYSGLINPGDKPTFEFGSRLRDWHISGRQKQFVNVLKEIIATKSKPNPVLMMTDEENEIKLQEKKKPVVLTEEDILNEEPLKICDMQVSMPTQYENEDEEIDKSLANCLTEKVNQRLVKIGAMNDDELKEQLKEVDIPKELKTTEELKTTKLSELYPGGKMKVLELDLLEDVLKDYGISFEKLKG